jgi:hypothetical protein
MVNFENKALDLAFEALKWFLNREIICPDFAVINKYMKFSRRFIQDW